jgi:hypothetical protein
MKPRYSAAACSSLLAFLLTAALCDARVFLRWGSASKSDIAVESAGGKKSYSSTLSINGGKGDLAVFSFDSHIRRTVTALSAVFKNNSIAYNGGSMAFALFSYDNKYIRLLLLQLDEKSGVMMFKIEQSAEEYEKSKKNPEKHLLEQAPEFPGSTPTFFARNDDTAMSLSVAESKTDPGAIRRFYADRLTSDGWEKMFPGINDADIYIRANSICYVMVAPAEKGGPGRIILLHKTHGIK